MTGPEFFPRPRRGSMLHAYGLSRVLGMAVRFLLVAVVLVNTSCQSAAQDPQKPHHTADGFRNNHAHESHGFFAFLKWRWDRLMGRMPERHNPALKFLRGENDPQFLRENRIRPILTWIAHATFLLQLGGVNLLTDPQFSERASPLSWWGPKRIMAPGIPLRELPPIDAVLISHNHYDHLDLATVRALAARPAGEGSTRVFVPLGLKEWFAGEGIENVVELDWWDSVEYKGLTLHAVPAQHFSKRSFFDNDETLWAGWVVEHPRFKFYIAGDTGYSPDFLEIGRRLGPLDLAALPIGAYEPRWFMRSMHLNPAEAVQVHQDLGARYSVGMHWGTFDLTDDLPGDGPKYLREALEAANIPPERFFLMEHGETREIAPLFPEG